MLPNPIAGQRRLTKKIIGTHIKNLVVVIIKKIVE